MLRKKIRIGDLLIQEGLITEENMQQALRVQKQTGNKLGRQLIELGYVTEDQILDLLSQQLQVPRVNPNNYWIDPETAANLPESYARRFTALVLEETGSDFLVAMADPSDLIAIDEINRVLKKPPRIGVARESAINDLINLVYRRTEEISNIAEELASELNKGDDIDLATLNIGESAASAPVVRLLQSLFEDALQIGASDLHIEPDENALRIRMRRDGVLQEQIFRQRNIHAAMVSLLKIMSGLDITERRLPQDGRFHIRVHGRSVDVRLSTLPLQHGEGVVMRLLDLSGGLASLEKTGIPEDMLRRLRRLIHMPYGMILVTGPTGSGKSTTLYGALQELNKSGVKIITVEDPVEYRLSRINQVQVNEKIGLTFSRVLRTCLRQDPDILMVGEMRDEETAEIGMRAAITGHLVFSTLHTNDAVATANRLLDMGIEPYMLVSALRAILAQRLLRRICTQCREPYTPTELERLWLEAAFGTSDYQLYAGKGCNACSNTGYSGRVGVFELLELTPDMINALRHNDQAGFAAACAADPNYQPMSNVALAYASKGLTTLEEVFRVLGEIDESELRLHQTKIDSLIAELDSQAAEQQLNHEAGDQPEVAQPDPATEQGATDGSGLAVKSEERSDQPPPTEDRAPIDNRSLLDALNAPIDRKDRHG
ncbi:GspE/PulE family protein [Halorhodospira halochloris]|uniref:GspE/PulE family protein n=1 Tax=Halorhodospira halochloris TaxID=1052 RepID=UPI001EE81A17|nr:GspE/PulE family protein [Halorhodospira halochloris]MCG5531252.1 GspE/PulE family protein [Halorhodospira halochloris]